MNIALTDLEEQILFVLEVRHPNLSIHQLTEQVTIDAGKSVNMARMHSTVWKLVAQKFVMRTWLNQKWMYAISASGSMVLQHEWKKYALPNAERL